MTQISPWLWPLAFFAGLISFISPCTFPLLPGYLSFITGLSTAEIGGTTARRHSLRASVMFVLGFTLTFSALGASASLIGSTLSIARPLLEKIAGIFILAMAAFMIGVLRLPVLQREWHWRHIHSRGGLVGAIFLGIAFAIGWTPCIGPVLAAILAVAGTEARAGQGALLLALYSLGLGLPFIIAGTYFSYVATSLKQIRRILPFFSYIGGIVLAVMGILLLSDHWLQAMAPLLRLYSQLNWPSL
jgi:cytochrome c-type biogenesis protein